MTLVNACIFESPSPDPSKREGVESGVESAERGERGDRGGRSGIEVGCFTIDRVVRAGVGDRERDREGRMLCESAGETERRGSNLTLLPVSLMIVMF